MIEGQTFPLSHNLDNFLFQTLLACQLEMLEGHRERKRFSPFHALSRVRIVPSHLTSGQPFSLEGPNKI